MFSSNKINLSKNTNQNIVKEEKNNNNKINKIKRNNSKSEKKNERTVKRLNNNKNSNNIISNHFFKNNTNLTQDVNDNILFNSILNLNSSVKISSNSNLASFLEKLKDNSNINNKEIYQNNNKNKIQNNNIKNINNINLKSVFDNIYSNLKKNKKNQTEFISFIRKIDKELNLNIYPLNSLNEEKIKELKKEINQMKNKESEAKLKLTFLQSEKIKLEEEKQKLQEKLKKINNSSPFKERFDYPLIKKNYSSTKKADGFINLNVNSELGRLTMNIINNSTDNKKEKIKENNDSSEKGIKYSFKKKQLINKSPSLEADTVLSYKKLLSNEKNSMSIYEDESNEINNENGKEKEKGEEKKIKDNNIENNEVINDLKNKINNLTNDINDLEDKNNNLNKQLENLKLKENNLEKINSNLIKENVDLKQSMLLLKENYENEFNTVSSSLIKLTEKYQKIKQELLKEEKICINNKIKQ